LATPFLFDDAKVFWISRFGGSLLGSLGLGVAVEASIDFKGVVDYNLVVSVRDGSALALQVLASHQTLRARQYR
jgi:hypothetical protein